MSRVDLKKGNFEFNLKTWYIEGRRKNLLQWNWSLVKKLKFIINIRSTFLNWLKKKKKIFLVINFKFFKLFKIEYTTFSSLLFSFFFKEIKQKLISIKYFIEYYFEVETF